MDSQLPAETDRPFFLLVGRLEKSKGFQNAIEVFKHYNEADLVIVGTGQFEQELHALAKGHPHIRLLGQLPYGDLVSLYRNAVAVIVPSIWYEPFGLIVIEAYAQRTPVIVNNAGALPELIADSEGGIVYEDNAQLQDAVTKLLAFPEQRNTLGQNGYDAYLRYWTEERHLEQYFALIDELRLRRESASPNA